MNFEKAMEIFRLIILGAVAAIPDLLHYPPPGSDPGSGMPGQSLAGFPRTLALRGDPSPKPAGCGRVVPVSQRSRACRKPGPGDADRSGRHLRPDLVCTICRKVQGATRVDQVGQLLRMYIMRYAWASVSRVAPWRPDGPGARASSCCTLSRTTQSRTGGLPKPVLLQAGLVTAGRPQLIWRTPAGRVSCHARQKFVP